MGIDYHQLKSWHIAPISQTYTERDTILYALGIGIGHDPIIDKQLRFVYEKELLAVPTMAGVLGYPGMWLKDPALGINWEKTVHGEQSMVFHRPLSVAGSIIGTNKVKSVIDKGQGRGALVVTERLLTDSSTGDLIATLLHTAFCRSDGGFSSHGKGGDEPLLPKHQLPSRAPDRVLEFETRPESALIYRLSGDYTPLHVDPSAAQAAGFSKPILHGMTTFGMAAHAILKGCCDYNPSRIRNISGRFSNPVFPGETIRTEIWLGKDFENSVEVMFRSSLVEREGIVLDNGYAEICINNSEDS